MGDKLININEASLKDLMEIHNIGQASAREIIKLREECDGALTIEDFHTLKCYKKHPMIIESFYFGIKYDFGDHTQDPNTNTLALVDQEGQSQAQPLDDQVNTQTDHGQSQQFSFGDPLQAHRPQSQVSRAPGVDIDKFYDDMIHDQGGLSQPVGMENLRIFLQHLMMERQKDKEIINNLRSSQAFDNNNFQQQCHSLRRDFERQSEASQANLLKLRNEYEEEQDNLKQEIERLRNSKNFLPTSSPLHSLGEVEYQLGPGRDSSDQVSQLEDELEKEKKKTQLLDNKLLQFEKRLNSLSQGKPPVVDGSTKPKAGSLEVPDGNIRTTSPVVNPLYQEPPKTQRFPDAPQPVVQPPVVIQDPQHQGAQPAQVISPKAPSVLGRLQHTIESVAPNGFYRYPQPVVPQHHTQTTRFPHHTQARFQHHNYQPVLPRYDQYLAAVQRTPVPVALDGHVSMHGTPSQVSQPSLSVASRETPDYGGMQTPVYGVHTPINVGGNRIPVNRGGMQTPIIGGYHRNQGVRRAMPIAAHPVNPVRERRQGGEYQSLPKLQYYDGTGRWKSFYLQFQTHARLKRWSEETKLNQLTCCLKNKALDFYSCQSEEVKANFNLTIAKLEKRFGKKDLKETLRAEFSQMRQHVDEPLEEWAERVQTLAMEAFATLPDDYITEETIRRFCYGCCDKESAQYASDRVPTSMDEALRFVKTHTQNNKAIYGSRKTVRQLSCAGCRDCDEASVESRSVRSINSGCQHSSCRYDDPVYESYDNHDRSCHQSTSCSVPLQHCQSAMSSIDTEEKFQVRKLNPNYGKSSGHKVGGFGERLNSLEEFCGKNFERLFKILEESRNRTYSPRRGAQSSPARGCFGCGGTDHFVVNCPKRDSPSRPAIRSSPSPARQSSGDNSATKVKFSSPLNKPGSSA